MNISQFSDEVLTQELRRRLGMRADQRDSATKTVDTMTNNYHIIAKELDDKTAKLGNAKIVIDELADALEKLGNCCTMGNREDIIQACHRARRILDKVPYLKGQL